LGGFRDQFDSILRTKPFELAVLEGKLGKPLHQVRGELLLAPYLLLVACAESRDAGWRVNLVNAHLKKGRWRRWERQHAPPSEPENARETSELNSVSTR